MEETSSYCSGSPERTTVYTPVNSSFEDCYTQVMGQFPYLGDTSGYDDEELDKSHLRQASVSSLRPTKLAFDLRGLHDSISETYEPYNDFFTAGWNDNKFLSRSLDDCTSASTRFLKLANINPSVPSTALFNYLQNVGDVQEYNTRNLESEGVCILSYFDLRDAIAAYIKIKGDREWTIQYCSQAYYSMLDTNDASHVHNLGLSDVVCAITSGLHFSNAAPVLYNCLHGFGTIYKFTVLRNTRLPTFLLSFYDHQTASDVVDLLDGQYVMGFHLKATLFEAEPSSRLMIPEALHVNTSDATRLNYPSKHSGLDIWSPHPIRPHLETPFKHGFATLSRGSPDSPSYEAEPVASNLFSGIYPCSQPQDHLHPISAEMLCNSHASSQHSPCRSTHSQCLHSPEGSTSCQKDCSSSLGYDKCSNQLAVPGKNIIDLDRIARGLDTRTTVMLRNIPNKVDQQTLKEYIDETSRGLYNFLYLRIDFRNICNVGYAFINFLDPLDIIDFVKAKSGTRWNKFNSEKVLDVTYANIQGIDQLVEKFRNSSVMDQDPAYRPKLFYSSGSRAGTEMEFPAANNILKKCRSISAAQQIGLFAPKLSAASKGVWRKRD